MGCKATRLGPDTVIWECSINEMAYYQWLSEQEEREYDHQQALADQEELPTREADMYYAREDVDPFWPAESVEGIEVIEVEFVPIDYSDQSKGSLNCSA